MRHYRQNEFRREWLNKNRRKARSNEPCVLTKPVLGVRVMRNGNFSNSNKKTPGFNSWRAMWERCTNQNYRKYHLYGGRGISVCERWRSFAAFMEDMGPRPSGKHSIERKDASGNYEPKNCV